MIKIFNSKKRIKSKKKKRLPDLHFVLTPKGEKRASEVSDDTREHRALLIIKERHTVSISEMSREIEESIRLTIKVLGRLRNKGYITVKTREMYHD